MSGCFLEDGAELMRNEYVLLTPLFSVLTAITICGFVMNRYLREEALAKYVLHHTDNVLVTQFKELEDALGERRDVEQERNRLSAQDNYAQWTKLNRRVEKLNEKVDVLSREMETYRRGRIDQYRRWIKYAVHGPQYFVKLWFANRPVLYWRGGLTTSNNWLTWMTAFPWGEKDSVTGMFWIVALERLLTVLVSFNEDVSRYRELRRCSSSKKDL
ncbi:hypothetical protein CAS74_003179 [Pichia kudriavzevii]|uniref:Golgi to ER traffic protein 1 n=1 Tax=Pichia kudriavzevii TaxID=4909 RepID=A0A099P4Y5_PICKU|nr:hypothetical protein JL09_g760 [Pichia kudriavzevii]ONH77620.1 Golgi to ER traffic protein 1 [Pichia kudriavzevii]OUT22188.1 hypothetical protein CAS74_003179 [Pichia kudriavzevii]